MSQLDGIFAPDLVDVAEKCKGQTVSMTKADLITIIADKLKFPWARAELLVETVFDSMEQSMSRGEKIEIRATRPNYPYTQTEFVDVSISAMFSPATSKEMAYHADTNLGDGRVPVSRRFSPSSSQKRQSRDWARRATSPQANER
jgi:hypothetical protein